MKSKEAQCFWKFQNIWRNKFFEGGKEESRHSFVTTEERRRERGGRSVDPSPPHKVPPQRRVPSFLPPFCAPETDTLRTLYSSESFVDPFQFHSIVSSSSGGKRKEFEEDTFLEGPTSNSAISEEQTERGDLKLTKSPFLKTRKCTSRTAGHLESLRDEVLFCAF